MRVCHYIKPNLRSETPSRLMVVSLDLDKKNKVLPDGEHEMKGGTVLCATKNARTGKWFSRNYSIATKDGFWALLETFVKSKTRTYVICNESAWTIALLDVLTVGPTLGWTLTTQVYACPPCIVNARRDSKSLTIIDILNIWPTLSFDTSTIKTNDGSDTETALKSNASDAKPSALRVQIMFNRMTSWLNFLKVNDLGGFSVTIGAQSVRVWRHRFMTEKVLIDLHDDALKLARDGLYGGRCEALQVGSWQGDFYLLDINSAYLYSLATMRVPVKLVGYTERTDVNEVASWIKTHVVVADCSISTDESVFPFRSDAILVFPRGTYRTCLAGKELERAIICGAVLQICRAAVYQSGSPFTQYANHVWFSRIQARARGDQADDERWKTLGAAFFGKWAQKGGHWVNDSYTRDLSLKHWIDHNYSTGVSTQYRQVGGTIQRLDTEPESRESHPAIAGCCTAETRLKLYEYMGMAGRENAFYVDTDSILVNAMGYRRLLPHVAPGTLGGLKVQGHYQTVTVFGPKHYRLDGQERFSGFKQNGYDARTGIGVQEERVGIQAQISCGNRISARTRTVTKRAKGASA